MQVTKDTNVLIVDDMAAMRKILTNILNEHYQIFNIIQAGNGKEAIASLQKTQGAVELILCDWNMPEMNGMDFFKFCQNSDEYKKIPFIMITAESDKAHVLEALKAGVNNYILKSFSAMEIKNRLDKIFKK
ncbi:MAG: response regulator [Pseudomonadota bacterium]